MYCSTEAFQHFFETLEFHKDENNNVLLLDPSVRIYCNADVDAICAAEIFKKLFYLKHKIWSIKPIRSSEDFDIRDRQPSPLAKSLRAIILLNFGGDIDLGRFFDLSSHPNLIVYVLDSQNPINLKNMYKTNHNIFIVLDNINSPENRDIIEKSESKELAGQKDNNYEMVGGYLVITDDFGRPIRKHWTAIDKPIPLATGPARRCNHGSSIALQTYTLASTILSNDNDMLWLAIIGHTSLFVSKKINLVEYNKMIGFLDAEVMGLNNSDGVQRIHRHKAVPAHSDDKRIIRINEYQCVLIGHWTLYDSMLNSEYTFNKMRLKENQAANLDRLLRNIGITHRMAKQNFPSMDVQVANSLAEMIKEEGPKFGLEYPLYSSYCKFYGYKQPSLSASDAAYGLITLLSTKKSASIEFGVEVRWVSDFGDDDSWLNNFYTVMEALDSRTGTSLLQSGIDLRKVLQPLFIQGGANEFYIL
ncbi:CDC45-like protein [Gigaspora margarita]|uniref:CDC45-like protein n=1 Tax=Gigaspora margarita TaxID=4874 RepID=A0A8H4AKK3_GIGMA|nr:CDC45-like protein [Gigaspora margarita]